jgi:hypothetical protein
LDRGGVLPTGPLAPPRQGTVEDDRLTHCQSD